MFRILFCENIILGIQLFNNCPHVQVEFFFISDFLVDSLGTNKNQLNRSLILQYIFGRKTSLILPTSTQLTLKLICFRNTAKNLSHFINFPANMFLFGVRKSTCTVFVVAQELHSRSTLKANVCLYISVYLRKKNYVPEKQQDFIWWDWGVRRG